MCRKKQTPCDCSCIVTRKTSNTHTHTHVHLLKEDKQSIGCCGDVWAQVWCGRPSRNAHAVRRMGKLWYCRRCNPTTHSFVGNVTIRTGFDRRWCERQYVSFRGLMGTIHTMLSLSVSCDHRHHRRRLAEARDIRKQLIDALSNFPRKYLSLSLSSHIRLSLFVPFLSRQFRPHFSDSELPKFANAASFASVKKGELVRNAFFRDCVAATVPPRSTRLHMVLFCLIGIASIVLRLLSIECQEGAFAHVSRPQSSRQVRNTVCLLSSLF
jgi:hypothetical protein